MKRRRLPPFSAVKAFEAAARHLSFKAAAEELCLSPSAISHQIRALEDYLATALFRRQSNRISLTATGRSYAGHLSQLLDHLDDSTRQALGYKTGSNLRVLSTPGFAARWLLPRLAGFAHADLIRLHIAEAAPSTDFTTNDADVVIKWRDQAESGLDVVPFLRSARYPVASPELLKRTAISHPRELLRQTLFRDEVDDQWSEWFRAAGVVAELPKGDPIYPNCEYAATAAEAGLGISLAYEAVVESTVANGSLVRLFEPTTLPFTIYAIATEKTRRNDPLIRAFRDWLLAEAAGQAGAVAPPPEQRQSRYYR
ncbi:LysR substrate-binding domain-containing protein [Neptunicoccus sediminis]|uniref:LysR substrate-binding domain-containing protein n=1 Tax=Neptunicoccus sediminis TaxID=1892596 RepID=UPI0008460232|nr:LysR substrate-binding domain-containing protein [Neptunicoccus sediminis]